MCTKYLYLVSVTSGMFQGQRYFADFEKDMKNRIKRQRLIKRFVCISILSYRVCQKFTDPLHKNWNRTTFDPPMYMQWTMEMWWGVFFKNISNNWPIWAEYNFMLEMFYFQLNIGILKKHYWWFTLRSLINELAQINR